MSDMPRIRQDAPKDLDDIDLADATGGGRRTYEPIVILKKIAETDIQSADPSSTLAGKDG